jgi:hypothetical protein
MGDETGKMAEGHGSASFLHQYSGLMQSKRFRLLLASAEFGPHGFKPLLSQLAVRLPIVPQVGF